jgi:signal transduction histidine kinase/ActR/RegA family two-component response regulator
LLLTYKEVQGVRILHAINYTQKGSLDRETARKMASDFIINLKISSQGFFRRIGVQLVVIFVVLIGISGSVFTYQATRSQAGQLIESITNHAQDESRTIALIIQSLLQAGHKDRIDSLIRSFEGDTEFQSIQVFSDRRTLLSEYNFIDKRGNTDPDYLRELANQMPSDRKPAKMLDKIHNRLDVWQPIPADGNSAWLHIAYTLNSVSSATNELWQRFLRIGYVLVLATIIILILGVRRSVVALEKYKNFAASLEDVEGQQVDVYRSSTELAQLGDALNKTSKRLQEQNDLHLNTMVVMERLAAFSENSPNILLSFDKKGNLQYINPRGQQVMLELNQENFDRLLPPNYLEMFDTCLDKQMKIEDVEVRLGDRVFLWSFSPVPGQPLIHAFATEITRRRQAEKIAHNAQVDKMRAEAANEAKSRFLANVSHELRTPLNAIIGYSEMLEEDAESQGDKTAGSDANRIQVAAKHLLHLINEILDLSKIEAGKMDIYYEPFDVHQVIEDIITTIDPAIKKNQNHLVVDCDKEIGFMICDMIKLRQMLFNLLSNAAKFTSNGKIELAVRREQRDDKEWFVFEVRDTGIGIEPIKQQRLFDAFVQADNSTTRKYGGTGLGLAISRKFCEMLGGSLTLESSPGVGSTFTVSLPAEQAPLPGMEAETAVEEEVDPRAQRLVQSPKETEQRENIGRILVIDDDPTFRESMVRYFQNEGFKVVTASNGQEGLLLASEFQPELITLDILMPGRNGWSILVALKKNPKLQSIPVLMISSAGDKHIGLRMGADEYLSKPVSWEQLDGVIKKLFRKTNA